MAEIISKSDVFTGAFNPSDLMGGDPRDFMSVMQTMSRMNSVLGDFGAFDSQDTDGPPQLTRIVSAIREQSSQQLLTGSEEAIHLNLLLAVPSDPVKPCQCQGPHAICVLVGTMMSGNATEKQDEVALKEGDLMVNGGDKMYTSSGDAPCLALLVTFSTPVVPGSTPQKLCKISLAKTARLAAEGAGSWQTDDKGEKIDWDADGALATGATPGSAPEILKTVSLPPVHLAAAFDATQVLDVNDKKFVAAIRSLSTQMPLQVHYEPETISGSDGPCIVRRAFNAVRDLAEVKELFENSGSDKCRLKMRLSCQGKFIHRNRYPRRQCYALLSGELTWLLVESQENQGAVDEMLGAVQNDNWNGYRCEKHPKMLSLEEMEEMQKNLPKGVESRLIKMTAGDVLVFDGRWWHATNYMNAGGAMAMFLTPGKDMEVAVKEQERRRKMPKQAKLKVLELYDL